ncbi:SMI1/KNR4 family protein [Priestia filamentosa]|uniref:SMI1/KNR4 family protein n=1 Tax=Priestia filamentosa TaxID=1402861 RepID=UPI000A088302|nr:SMI1/KNR4 family protein [Priestia filamentosa]MDT3762603.1 SMI1/KNR4 family protein [Priestia filamentosa]WRU97070.1 SMI1/KNR4 family protein [Priestia filamentosa]SMF28663.1 SMI1-KNR4 cell-wall [Priestia filamentosa]
MELFAIEGEDFASVAEDTEYFRTGGLPQKYIVIEKVDKFVYCLNTVDGHNVIS